MKRSLADLLTGIGLRCLGWACRLDPYLRVHEAPHESRDEDMCTPLTSAGHVRW